MALPSEPNSGLGLGGVLCAALLGVAIAAIRTSTMSSPNKKGDEPAFVAFDEKHRGAAPIAAAADEAIRAAVRRSRR